MSQWVRNENGEYVQINNSILVDNVLLVYLNPRTDLDLMELTPDILQETLINIAYLCF